MRKISGSRHIISATVDVNNFSGACKGTGRIQIRLNHGETADQVKLNYLRKGYQVADYNLDPRKKPIVTGIPQQPQQQEWQDARLVKQNELLSK